MALLTDGKSIGVKKPETSKTTKPPNWGVETWKLLSSISTTTNESSVDTKHDSKNLSHVPNSKITISEFGGDWDWDVYIARDLVCMMIKDETEPIFGGHTGVVIVNTGSFDIYDVDLP